MTICTTPGGSSSNSFITVSEADSYLAATTLFDATPWEDLTESHKEERLMHAALLMKTGFHWIGRPVYKRQALPFPRRLPDAQDVDGSTITIPEPIRKAQAYIALDIVHRAAVGLTPASHGMSRRDLKRLSLFGSLDVTLGEMPHAPSDPSSLGRSVASAHWVVQHILSPYVTTVQCITPASADDAYELLDEVS